MAYKQLGFVGPSQDTSMGQDGTWITSPDGTVMQNLDTGSVIVLPDAGSPSIYPTQTQPAQAGGDWWSGLQNILTPVSSIAGAIAKAIGGTSAGLPSGYKYDSVTGRVVPVGYQASTGLFGTSSTWLLPVALIGVAAFAMMKKR